MANEIPIEITDKDSAYREAASRIFDKIVIDDTNPFDVIRIDDVLVDANVVEEEAGAWVQVHIFVPHTKITVTDAMISDEIDSVIKLHDEDEGTLYMAHVFPYDTWFNLSTERAEAIAYFQKLRTDGEENTRLYVEAYEDEDGKENDEMLWEDCAFGFGSFPD